MICILPGHLGTSDKAYPPRELERQNWENEFDSDPGSWDLIIQEFRPELFFWLRKEKYNAGYLFKNKVKSLLIGAAS